MPPSKADALVDEQDLSEPLLSSLQVRRGGSGQETSDCRRQLKHKTFKGSTALLLASEKGHAIIVSLLLSKGADTEIKDLKGNCALSIARKRGRRSSSPSGGLSCG